MTNLTETPGPTTRRRSLPGPDRLSGRAVDGGATPRGPRSRRPPTRRLLLLAGVASGLVHLLLLWAVRVPAPDAPRPGTEVRVRFEPVVPARPETAPAPEAPAEGAGEPAAEVDAPAARPPIVEAPEIPIARPRPSPRAPDSRTIPPTTLRAPLTPLVATPGGIGRRTSTVDARRIEIMRAESLLASRLADLPGAGVPEDPSAGLAEGGGVTIPIPWGGFIPENRKEGVWREERCSGRDADEADKPGEGEARGSQCD